MYDNGFPDSPSDEEEEKVDYDKHFNLEEGEYPNLDSPRMTNDIKIDRTFKVNRKVDNDQEEEWNIAAEEDPEIPNETSPGIDRKASTSTSQGDYEVIGDHVVRDTIVMKNKPSEDCKENFGVSYHRKYSIEPQKLAKTDKGYSEISQLKKKNLSVMVGVF